VTLHTLDDSGRNFFGLAAVQVYRCLACGDDWMSLRGNRSGIVLRPWLAAAHETTLMLAFAVGVCLSWPQVAQSMLLATKIAYYYCVSPR
jgi:hypothetical protein